MATLDLAGLGQALESINLGGLPRVDSADVLYKPLDIPRTYLADILGSLSGCGAEAAYKSIQHPKNSDDGDFAVVLPKLSQGARNVRELGFDLTDRFPREHPFFDLPFFPEGVHLRIFLKTKTLARLVLPFIFDRKGSYGNDVTLGLRNSSSPEGGRKKLVVEFSSPNVTGEFLGRHLRSTILGQFVDKFYKSMGWDVVRLNYFSDWGMPEGLLNVGWGRFGNEEAFQADPVGHLLEVYRQIDELFQPEIAASRHARDEAARNGHDEGEAQAEIESQGIYAERNAAFKKLEDGDEEAVALWKRAREVIFKEYTDFYAGLGIEFDECTGESQVSTETMTEVEQMLKEKGICEESAGAWVIHMQNHGLKAGTVMIRFRHGGTTYFLRDLAAMIERSRKYEFDKMIIVAGDNNQQHFIHLNCILKALGMEDLANKIQYMRFSQVSNMVDKLGRGYRPKAIITHCEEAMTATLEADQEKTQVFGSIVKAAKDLSISALFVHELATRTVSAQSFDTTPMTAFKPGTGPEIQLWYAKLCSLLKGHSVSMNLCEEDYDALVGGDEAYLLRILVQYPEVTYTTYHASSLEPATIITYLTSVIEQLSQCLSEEDENEVGQERRVGESSGSATDDEDQQTTLSAGHVALYEATRIVLENGMRLLGLKPYTKTELERADTPIAE